MNYVQPVYYWEKNVEILKKKLEEKPEKICFEIEEEIEERDKRGNKKKRRNPGVPKRKFVWKKWMTVIFLFYFVVMFIVTVFYLFAIFFAQ